MSLTARIRENHGAVKRDRTPVELQIHPGKPGRISAQAPGVRREWLAERSLQTERCSTPISSCWKRILYGWELWIFGGRSFCEGGSQLSLCHGSPWETRGRLMQDKNLAVRVLESLSGCFALRTYTLPRRIFLSGKKLVNPGSVGMSPDVPGRASFALLTWDNESLAGGVL